MELTQGPRPHNNALLLSISIPIVKHYVYFSALFNSSNSVVVTFIFDNGSHEHFHNGVLYVGAPRSLLFSISLEKIVKFSSLR